MDFNGNEIHDFFVVMHTTKRSGVPFVSYKKTGGK